jgi:hypothetical protein
MKTGPSQPVVGSLHANLAWSPWLKDDLMEASVLAYLNGYSLELYKASVQHTSKTRQNGTNYSSFTAQIAHQFSEELENVQVHMKWHRATDNDDLKLILVDPSRTRLVVYPAALMRDDGSEMQHLETEDLSVELSDPHNPVVGVHFPAVCV